MLPARFLTQYGVYLQTCAHIEKTCWDIYRLADPKAKELESKDSYSLIKDKLSTAGLLKKFKACAKHCSVPLQMRILTAHNQILDGVESRNTAAHGAWFLEEKTQHLRVEHYFIRKGDPQGTWRFYDEPIVQKTLDETLETADSLLSELIDIKITLSQLVEHGKK